VRPQDIIRQHYLLSVLEPHEACDLLQRASVRYCRSGETLFRRGDPGDGLYGVLAGRIVVSVESQAGKELILNTFGPGDLLGEIALLDGKGRTATAVARAPSELLFIARRKFLPFIEERPAIALRMITLLCERLRRTTDMVEDSTFLGLPARLAKQLLALALSSGDGASLHVDLLQSELADMMGVSREAVSKQLSLWRAAGMIGMSRGRITINNPGDLEAVMKLV
jgi:CRP-like cAMP-binding protein